MSDHATPITGRCCPHCDSALSDDQIKSLWASYCARRVPKEKRGGGAKPWKQHSDAAGLRCRCVDCIRMREIRLADYEATRKRVEEVAPAREDLTWDSIVKVNPEDGYEALVRYEASLIRAKKKAKAARAVGQARRTAKMRMLRDRAKQEKVYGKVMAEAERMAEDSGG